jgi:hypothetical protein
MFDDLPPPRHQTRQPSAPSQDDDYNDALAYHNQEAKDDNEDYIACMFQQWQAAMAEGREFEYPTTMTDDEIEAISPACSSNGRRPWRKAGSSSTRPPAWATPPPPPQEPPAYVPPLAN